MSRLNRQAGQAIVLVVTILAVVSVIGFAFMYMAQMQLRGATSYLARLQTKYLAEAGINHAKELIEFDKQANAIDTYEDIWSTTFQGSDVDLDNDGAAESKWFYVQDDQGHDIGRYAVLVSDESGKVNINTAGQYTGMGISQGYTTFEISLSNFVNSVGLGGISLVNDIFNYRYGSDHKPGRVNIDDNSNNYSLERDSLDNDADGIIDEANEGVDEPDEFNLEEPLGDDHPFAVVEELKKLGGISSSAFANAVKFITVSSKDQETDVYGALRQNINYIKPDSLVKIMLDRGVGDSWQKAANIIDSIDTNSSRTSVFKHYNELRATAAGFTGSWSSSGGYYQSNTPGGQGAWNWQNLPFSDGEYYCFVYGYGAGPVGDVAIGGATQKRMQDGDAFIMGANRKVSVSGGKFSITIQNNEELGKICRFSYIELVSKDIDSSPASMSKEVSGVEAVRINEIMVKPELELSTSSTAIAGGTWSWQDGCFVNSSPESGQQGEGSWVFTDIPSGNYYLKVLGREGDFVGDVKVSGRIQTSLRHGENFTASKSVRVSNNKLVVTIQNNFSDKTCYFKGIILSQQPDTEYVELVNISNNAVNLGGWMLETTGQEAVTAYIPQGTSIAPYGYLVLCVDRNDQAQDIQGNTISYMDTWATKPAAQLDFFKVLDRDFDFLKDQPVADENFLILREADGKVVDKIEYLASQVQSFLSLERGDPSEQRDDNNNSVFDAWYPTLDLSGGTPAKANDNIGMDKDQFTNHAIKEVNVRNAPVSNILDLVSVSQSRDWRNMSLSEISLMVDALTIFGTALYPKGNNLSGWKSILGGEGGYSSDSPGEEGVWRWENLNNGSYYLTIKGEPDEAMTVSYKKADDSWQLLAQEAIPDAAGLVYAGIIKIGTEDPSSSPDNTLEIKLQNASGSQTAHFYYLRLDPGCNLYGRININTAPKEVLMALPNVDSQAASVILSNRPFGNQGNMLRGIGDLFVSSIFSGDSQRNSKLGALSNLATIRTSVFGIIARAEVLDRDQVIATQEIKTIIER